jgi:hypothetical protein
MACFTVSEWECDTCPNHRPPYVTYLLVGVDPVTSGQGKALGKAAQPACPCVFLVIYVLNIVFNIVTLYIWALIGSGLSPDPWSCVMLYATSATVVTTVTIYCNHLIYVRTMYYVTIVSLRMGFNIWFQHLCNHYPCCVLA